MLEYTQLIQKKAGDNGRKEQRNVGIYRGEKGKIIDLSPIMSIIALNINGFNHSLSNFFL